MYIHVKVRTKMKEEKVERISADHYEIALKEPAKQNLANKRILKIMTDLYPNRQIRIINGHHSPSKLLSINNDED